MLLVIGSVRPALAQSEPSACSNETAEVLSAPANRGVPFTITRCPVSGPAALAELWARPGSRAESAREALVEASAIMRDARLFRALLRVANGRDFPAEERLAVLRVLLRFYDGRYAPSREYLLSTERYRSIPTMAGSPDVVEGIEPLPADARRQIGEVLARLSVGDDNLQIRGAALRLRQALAFRDPANVPLPPGSITLVAGCGDRVTLRSTADIDAPVRLQVLGEAREYGRGIRAGTTEKPSEILFGLPPGTVVAMYGEREVARLEDRNAPCAPGMIHGKSK